MELVTKIALNLRLTMPGWEIERLKRLPYIFEAYKSVTQEYLFENLKYFLDQIILVAEINDIKMA